MTWSAVCALLAPRARGVDEDRDPAQPAQRLLGEAQRLARPRQVGVGEVGAEHRRALGGERRRDRPADAAAGAGDERGVAPQELRATQTPRSRFHMLDSPV